jgi:hypothetical protein
MARSRADRPALAAAIVGALVAIAAVARADSWERTRKAVIDPINTEFHRHLPKALAKRSLDEVLGLYAVERGSGIGWESDPTHPAFREETRRFRRAAEDETIRERYEHMLAVFPKIEKAELRIHRVRWDEETADGWPAQARLIVRGTRADGSAAVLDQTVQWRIAKRDGAWKITAEEVTARELVARRSPAFEVATEKAGVFDTHTNEGSPAFRIIGGTTSSSGSTIGDFDGDGCDDLFLPGSPRSRLYRNDCRGRFEDVTRAVGIPDPFPAVATAAVFFDADNDGRPDLFVTAVAGGNRLFRNVADARNGARFVEVTESAGIPSDAWSSMPVVADYDRDGFLDVYVVRMGNHAETAPKPNYQAENGLPNRLLRNAGDFTFRDVTKEAGVGDRGWGLAGAWGDYDDDGWPDLYVANEYGYSVLYRNDGKGGFDEVGDETGARIRTAGMGVAFADPDGDGRLDVFVSAMYSNSRWALFHPDFPAPIPWPYKVLGLFTSEVRRRTEGIIEDLTRGSTLLRNRGDGTFADVSDESGIRDTQWSWGLEFLDYDNDGRLDLFVQNGFVTGELPDDV